MTWFERMNMAIDYIESNLQNDIDLNRVSEIALQSVSNFQRVFSIIADVSLAEYIRKRRLTLAAFELQTTNIKIVDLALKYNYESPEAFARAFNILHGVTPTIARQKGICLKSFPRISFLLTVKGVTAMNYKIEKREAFQVYGLEDIYKCENIENQNGRTIPQVWQDICANGEFERLCKSTPADWYVEADFSKEVGVVFAFDSYRYTSNTTFPYLIGCYKTNKSDINSYTVIDVPAATWAIFPTIYESGKLDLRTLKNRIFSEWLQTSRYRILEGGNFEMYCRNEKGEEYCELWYRVEEV